MYIAPCRTLVSGLGAEQRAGGKARAPADAVRRNDRERDRRSQSKIPQHAHLSGTRPGEPRVSDLDKPACPKVARGLRNLFRSQKPRLRATPSPQAWGSRRNVQPGNTLGVIETEGSMRRSSWMLLLIAFVAGLAAGAAFFGLGAWLRGRVIGSRPPRSRTGREIPRRIVCLAPNIAESVFAVGAGSQVVGVSAFSRFPPAVRRIPSVGGPVTPSLERIAALEPDLVLAQMPNAAVRAFCEVRAIPFVVLGMHSVSGILRGILRIGRLTGHVPAAARRVRRIRRELAEIRRRTRGASHPKVFLTVGRSPGETSTIFTVARGSFLNELLAVAGARNVFSDIPRPYPEVSKEAIVRRAPEIILETLPGTRLTPSARRRLIDDWRLFPTIPAVRLQRIYLLEDPVLQIPGPRVAQVARILAAVCHPGLFAPEAALGEGGKASASRAKSAGLNSPARAVEATPTAENRVSGSGAR